MKRAKNRFNLNILNTIMGATQIFVIMLFSIMHFSAYSVVMKAAKTINLDVRIALVSENR